ncbi:MAG: ATP synthase F1 subunit epsilon [Bacteroidetes bacterium 4572_77]|nr:MAG: ATP synthase F1 subunit epsilon [Bacteroidetes bacterium 4572_77]
MAGSFKLKIVTPTRSFFDGDVEMVIIRVAEGDIGILKDHEPIVSPVSIGPIRIKNTDGKFVEAACAGGFMTVTDEMTTIVTDAAEWAHEIDIERAKEALRRSRERLDSEDKEVDVVRARTSLNRAMNRLRITGMDV